jgi:hypothetical protein
MRGKRIMTVRPATETNEILTKEIFKVYGMDREKDIIAMPNLTPADQAAAMRQGTAYAAFQYSAGGVPAYQELHNTKPIRFVPLSKEAMAAITKTYPWLVETKILAASYTGMKEDVPGLGQLAGLQVTKELPDDLVYAIVKTTYENMDYLKSAHAGFNEMTIQNGPAMYGSYPLHAGAIKYFKERGVWTAEMEKANQEHLKALTQTK